MLYNLAEGYQDDTLLKKINQIAAMQRTGKIVVNGHGEHLPLPSITDVDYKATSYPFAYQCEWGRFSHPPVEKYDELYTCFYEFTPNNGQLPPGWEQYPLPLQAVSIEIDEANQVGTIKTSDQEVTFRDLEVGKVSGWTLLNGINTKLREAHLPLVAWKIEMKDSDSKNRGLWKQQNVPKVKNSQTEAWLAGYALTTHQGEKRAIYLSMVGHKTSLDSLRATLQAAKKQRKVVWVDSNMAMPAEQGYVQSWNSLPDFTAHHMVMISSLGIPGRFHPDDPYLCLLAFDGQVDEKQSVEDCLIQQLAVRLSEALRIPILPNWGKALWEAGKDEMLTEMQTGGDCLAGWQVSLNEEAWARIVQSLLKEKTISIGA